MFEMNQSLLIFALLHLLTIGSAANSSQLQSGQTMKALGIVPDVIDVEPPSSITVNYRSFMLLPKIYHQVPEFFVDKIR